MINSEINTTDVSSTATFRKQPVFTTKKVALRDVQNNNNNNKLTRDTRAESLPSVEASKACGTKRATPEYASSPTLTNNRPCMRLNFFLSKKSGSPQIKQEVSQVNGKNMHYSSVEAPNQTVSQTSGSRFKESNDEKRADRLVNLQNFINQCDGSDYRDNIQLLLRLSPVELSRHAVELEKRAIQLTIEEGKEMQRMQALNILGKPSITRNPMPITQHIQHKN